MTDRPILFSSPMVLAILREIKAPGTGKTQTRRVAKRQDIVLRNGRPFVPTGVHSELPFSRPGWDVGDRLWVRETWKLTQVGGGAGGGMLPFRAYESRYRADDHTDYFEFTGDDDPFLSIVSDTWRPSIFMPRWASRITLTVTDVRVERLQDITEADARAEGIISYGDVLKSEPGEAETPQATATRLRWPQRQFAQLWDSINKERGFGWDRNPWVVVLTFRPEFSGASLSDQRQKEPA